MHFIDEAKIYIKSGDGGSGCVSFHREKFVEFGGPNGGNGGKGADVLFKATKDLNTLIDFRYRQHFKAENGKPGQGKNKTGSSGKTLIITVPVGTQIIAEDGSSLIADLTEHGQEYLIAKGGKGGIGNAQFKSSVNRAPRKSTPGWPGEETWVWLKLKLLADVGLIGMPNAGKSTLLSKISRARPKVADYPFTTLKPSLGMVFVDEAEFTVADIPGLIAGASKGLGLGHRFLKHVERCKTLIHLVDISSPEAAENYSVVRKELSSYSSKLAKKPEIILLNKVDLVDSEEIELKKKQLSELANRMSGREVHIIECSTLDEEKITLAKRKMLHLVRN